MHNLKLLIHKDLLQVKNYFKEFSSNRKKMIPIVFYILWFLFMLRSQDGNELYSINYFKNFSLAILSFLLIISLINVYFERNSYFSVADVNFVFTSPLDSKLVLIYSIFKTSWKQLLAALFMFVFLSPSLLSAGVEIPRLFIGVLGYALFILSIEPLCFVTSQVGKVIGLRRAIGFFVLIILLNISIPIFIKGSFLSGMQSDLMHWVPLIGWARRVFLGMFNINASFYKALMALSGFIIFINLYIIKTTTNYYEDVITATENKEAYAKLKKTGRSNFKLEFKFKRNQRKTIESKAHGAFAFHWKNKLKALREDFHYLYGIKTLVFFLMSLALFCLVQFNIIDFELDTLYIIATGILLYILTLFSLNTGGENELNMAFFYLIPENNVKKVVALNQLNFIQMGINTLFFYSLPIIFDYSNTLTYILLMLVFNAVYWMIKYSYLLIKAIFRNETDFTLMLPLIKIFQLFLVIIPSIIGGAIAGFLAMTLPITADYLLPLLIFLVNCCSIIIILALSDVLINRIEI